MTNHLSSIVWIQPAEARQLRQLISSKLKAVGNLDKSATPDWLYAPPSVGGLGIIPVDHWILGKQIFTFMKNFLSRHPLVKIAMTQIKTQLRFKPYRSTELFKISFPFPKNPAYQELVPLASLDAL